MLNFSLLIIEFPKYSVSLYTVFPKRWIGLGGHIPSQLLNIIHLFFGGGRGGSYNKDRVHQTFVSDISALKERIQLAILTVTVQMF